TWSGPADGTLGEEEAAGGSGNVPRLGAISAAALLARQIGSAALSLARATFERASRPHGFFPGPQLEVSARGRRRADSHRARCEAAEQGNRRVQRRSRRSGYPLFADFHAAAAT